VKASRLQAPDTPLDLPDFLRRLSDMMTGGRNAEMLALAACEIEALRRRAATAEELYRAREDDHMRNLELREVAELASDNLIADIAALKAARDAEKQAADAERSLFESEIRRLQAEVADSEARAAQFAADMKAYLSELSIAAQARIAGLTAEVEQLRRQQQIIDETVAVVPVEQLLLARTQFDYLAKAFAGSGDVISLTICQIGACAIDRALGAGATETDQPPAATRAI
jgi:hypothetical protein